MQGVVLGLLLAVGVLVALLCLAEMDRAPSTDLLEPESALVVAAAQAAGAPAAPGDALRGAQSGRAGVDRFSRWPEMTAPFPYASLADIHGDSEAHRVAVQKALWTKDRVAAPVCGPPADAAMCRAWGIDDRYFDDFAPVYLHPELERVLPVRVALHKTSRPVWCGAPHAPVGSGDQSGGPVGKASGTRRRAS